uniref:Dynactin subunit 2 n=1 Tax=Homo sapiens TaxID=9606 RepID=F8VX93_HUMAN
MADPKYADLPGIVRMSQMFMKLATYLRMIKRSSMRRS